MLYIPTHKLFTIFNENGSYEKRYDKIKFLY